MSEELTYLPPSCKSDICTCTPGGHMYHRSSRCLSGECTHAKQGLHCGEWRPDRPAPGKDTGRAGASTRNAGRVLSLITDAVRWTTPAVTDVEVITGDRGIALALVLTFFDGDRWTVAVTPHRDTPAGPVVQELAPGVTYISHGGGPDPAPLPPKRVVYLAQLDERQPVDAALGSLGAAQKVVEDLAREHSQPPADVQWEDMTSLGYPGCWRYVTHSEFGAINEYGSVQQIEVTEQ